MHKSVIGTTKQASSQENWIELYSNIEKYVSYDHIKMRTIETLEKMVQSVNGNVAFGWSGGKDALVTEKLCSMIGINNGVLITSELEWEDARIHYELSKKENVVSIDSGVGYEWVASDEENLVFPTKSRDRSRYFSAIQKKGLRNYFFKNNLDQMIVGHRRTDGNFIKERVTVNKDGYCRNHIIMDWTHEEVIAFLYYNNIDLPMYYFYEDGFVDGSGPITSIARRGRTLTECWSYVYQYDKKAVEKASKHLGSAYEFMNSIQ